jgi:hypothetical protein
MSAGAFENIKSPTGKEVKPGQALEGILFIIPL